MDAQRTPVLTWAYFLQAKNADELRHSLLCTTLELEQTRIAVQEEIKRRDEQISHLKELLSQAIAERDQANEKCEKLLLEKLFPPPVSAISTIEDEPIRGIDISSSDCEESIVSSPIPAEIAADWLPEKPLPPKGSLLQAVVKAGPLLQTLLLAGPLPQWRHPPPPLESFQLPPIGVPLPPPPPQPQGVKRVAAAVCGELESPAAAKLQRRLFH